MKGTTASSVKRSDIASAVADRLGTVTAPQADQIIELAFNEIARQIQQGRTVKISGYAIFERVVRPARMARNPRTGEEVKVRAKKVPKFRPGTRLLDAASGQRPLPTSFERTPAQRRAAARKEAAEKKAREAAEASGTDDPRSKKGQAKPTPAKKATRKKLA